MQLFYKEYPGSGEPLIIMHGLFGMLDNWHNLARKFSERYHVFLLDLRNHGQSPHSDQINYKLMAADVNEFMEDRKLEKAFVMGHSMGGKVAMEFALTYPEKCEKLVVVDIAPVKYKPGHDDVFEALFSVDLNDGSKKRSELDEEMAAFLPEFSVRQFLLKSLVREGDKFAWKFNLEALHDNYEDIISEIKGNRSFEGPVLFVRGSGSKYVLDSYKETIAALFPEYRMETIEGSGHWVHAEKPAELIEAVSHFLT